MKINKDIHLLVRENVNDVMNGLVNEGYSICWNSMDKEENISRFINDDKNWNYISNKIEYIITKDGKDYILCICMIKHKIYRNLYTYRIYVKEYKTRMYSDINSNSKMMMNLYVVKMQDEKFMLMDNLDEAIYLVTKINNRISEKCGIHDVLMTFNLKKTRFIGFKKNATVEIIRPTNARYVYHRITNKNGKSTTIRAGSYWHDLKLDNK